MSDADRGWSTGSALGPGWEAAIGDEPYRMTEAELAKLPSRMRASMLARREQYDRKHALVYAAELRLVGKQNRDAALRALDGGLFVAVCACGFHGLRVTDPEAARREYDAHPCSLDGDSIHRKYRGPVDKRPTSAMVEARTRVDEVPVAVQPTQPDDTEQRMALLELK